MYYIIDKKRNSTNELEQFGNEKTINNINIKNLHKSLLNKNKKTLKIKIIYPNKNENITPQIMPKNYNYKEKPAKIQKNNENFQNININKEKNFDPIKEYENIIMYNLFSEELINRANYENFQLNTKNIFPNNERLKCINFFIYFSKFTNHQEILYLSINLFDRYMEILLNQNFENKINFQLISFVIVFIAEKYEGVYDWTLNDLIRCSNNKYNKKLFFEYELKILKSLNFELHITSQYFFLEKFYDTMKSDLGLVVFHGAQFILELCLIDIKFCQLKPSMQATICLFLAKKIINDKENNKSKNLWSLQNIFDTGYTKNEIIENINIALNLLINFFNGNIFEDYKTAEVYKKFSKINYSEVVYYVEKKINMFINKIIKK